MILHIDNGPQADREIPVDGPLVLGRAEDCGLRIIDEAASRHHAEIRVEGGRATLRDLDSANGTRLNGQRVTGEVLLTCGDVIRIGSVEISVLSGREADRETVLEAASRDETPQTAKVESILDPSQADILKASPRREDLELAYSLIRDLPSEVGSEDLLRGFLEKLVKLFGATTGAIRLVDKRGLPKGDIVHPANSRPAASRTIEKIVLGRREAVLLSQMDAPGSESVVASRVTSIIAVPLLAGRTVLGFAYLDRRHGAATHFSEHELALLAEVAAQLSRALQAAREHANRVEHLSRLAETRSGEDLVGESPRFLAALESARRAAALSSPVLITGPTGSGKELVALLVHRNSPLSSEIFVPVNCAAIPEGLIESELFGHEAGSFTGAVKRRIGCFEAADGGTLFLDEVGELSASTQVKLLRAIDRGEFRRVGGEKLVNVTVRIVAATNRDLEAEVKSGRFREDLFYRLNVLSVKLPSLAERGSDIVLLARYFLRRKCAEMKKHGLEFSTDALAAFQSYPWPGNVRELANVVERAIVLARATVITAADLPHDMTGHSAKSPETGVPPSLAEVERRAVLAALEHTGWKKGEAAKLLGVSWPTLNKKIEKHSLKPPPELKDT